MSKFAVQAGWEDVPHLSAEAKREMEAAFPPYQRDARTKGVPALGSGAIFPVPESEIIVKPFDVPAFWPRAYGLDVGWNRTCAIWGALDRETDCVYLYSEHYQGRQEPALHSVAIRARGDWIPGLIDPAARGRGQADGEKLINAYRDNGLILQPAKNAVEFGIVNLWQRLSTGRCKVFSSLLNWLGEYRLYRRDDKGHVVKEDDHAMDATRYLVNDIVAVAQVDPNYLRKLGHAPQVQADWDPYAGAHEA